MTIPSPGGRRRWRGDVQPELPSDRLVTVLTETIGGRRKLFTYYLLLLALCHRTLAEPPKGGTALFEGVWCFQEHRDTPRPLNIYIMVIDLNAEGIRFTVTTPNPGRTGGKDEVILKRTTLFAREMKAQVAINGTFFASDKKPWKEGEPAGVSFLAVYDGTLYSKRSQDDEVIVRWTGRGLDLWVQPGAAPWTFKPGDGQMALGMARWAQLLRDGEVVASHGEDLHPRTAVGLDKARRTAFLVVVDGRQKGVSEGVSLQELAKLAAEFGAHSAVNLDGGGSTTLVVQQPDDTYKVVNRPSDLYPVCVERPVGTHLAVFARKLPADPAAGGGKERQ